jgi:hypothetical protein
LTGKNGDDIINLNSRRIYYAVFGQIEGIRAIKAGERRNPDSIKYRTFPKKYTRRI